MIGECVANDRFEKHRNFLVNFCVSDISLLEINILCSFILKISNQAIFEINNFLFLTSYYSNSCRACQYMQSYTGLELITFTKIKRIWIKEGYALNRRRLWKTNMRSIHLYLIFLAFRKICFLSNSLKRVFAILNTNYL